MCPGGGEVVVRCHGALQPPVWLAIVTSLTLSNYGQTCERENVRAVSIFEVFMGGLPCLASITVHHVGVA